MKQLFENTDNESNNLIKVSETNYHDIAIIGIGSKLPMSGTLDVFWEHLKKGKDFIQYPTTERKKDIDLINSAKNKDYSNYKYIQGAFLGDVDKFDHNFFNISYKEACLMDPYQRLFLETVWHSLEDAGYSEEKIKGSNTGVFLGRPQDSDYFDWINQFDKEYSFMALPGNIPSVIASRISYILDLKGPSMLIDTACSSSLVALHQACKALRSKECDMAIAGGINLILNPVYEAGTTKPDILSSDFRAKPFDESSDGTGSGEGSISLLLKSYKTAMLDKNKIYAVIKGSAINQDGNTIGITAPNVDMQKKVLMSSWEDARINPEKISFIETHGTGTKLGDPIEIKGITEAFRHYTERQCFCAVGSIKGNIGHLDSAAGILSVLKAILCLRNKHLPPLAHFKQINSEINLEKSPLYINSRSTSWDSQNNELRRCGVSSFGLSGTNCHIVLEEHKNEENIRTKPEENHILCLSAKTEDALKRLISDYINYFRGRIHIANTCYTSAIGRNHYTHRVAIIGQNAESFKRKLDLLDQIGLSSIDLEGIYYCKLHDIVKKITTDQINSSFMDTNNLKMIAQKYIDGFDIDWTQLYHDVYELVDIPLYSFERKACWLNLETENNEKSCISINNNTIDDIQEYLQRFISKAFNIEYNLVRIKADFFEFGMDSISIIQLRQTVQNQYNISISVEELFQNLINIEKLSKYIFTKLSESDHDQKSLQISIKSNTNYLNEKYSELPILHTDEIIDTNKKISLHDNNLKNSNLSRFIVKEDKNFNEKQQQFFNSFISKFIERTKTSKEMMVKHRNYWAHDRFSLGYSPQWKELVYPILIEKGQGSKIWDVDGNEYIDFSMGFGALLLGYNHPLLVDAIQKDQNPGMIFGPLTPSGGIVAKLVHDITGLDKVSFYNSGTEAVMFAVKMARASTGKDKIVIFEGSFHGTFDGINARKDYLSNSDRAVPSSIGTPQKLIDDIIVLAYDSEESIERIKKHSSSIGGILVEPVQSRKPQLQPKEFLFKLRDIADQLDIPLIFDEVITGFRLHPRGAQGYFNIEADIVTYGKIAGGGMPIGILAGKSKYMDRIDGGQWNYGDNSKPNMNIMVTGGTFSCHPVSMAASQAILEFLKVEGESLYNKLNSKTQKLVDDLNSYFNEQKIPIDMVHCASMFSFKPKKDVLFLRFLFYKLAYKGIYLWEGATCFISVVHTEEDIQFLIKTIKESCSELILSGTFNIPNNKMDNFFQLSNGKKQNSTIVEIEGNSIYLNSKIIEGFKPFNDVFFKSCFYNSLFPIIQKFGKDIEHILVNDISSYSLQSDKKILRVGIKFDSVRSNKELLNDIGVICIEKMRSENIIKEIIESINRNNPVLLWIDCFYESIRNDTFNKIHLDHTILVYGYNIQEETFNIIEHDNCQNLTYDNITIGFKDLMNSYEGFINTFMTDTRISYFEFSDTGKNNNHISKNDYGRKLNENLNDLENKIQKGHQNLFLFIQKYKTLVNRGDLLSLNIDLLLEGINEIINAKDSEKYLFIMLFHTQFEEIEILQEIIDKWKKFRTIIARLLYSAKYNEKSLIDSISILQTIYKKELYYLKLRENKRKSLIK
ncbi:MAG: aminotransferase class III-fold pyridoxal phosphate-dependent enzyme [bacterium]|nr:aminotransferase class III-fold pyridoxal phosphate-dependent enzyme [bacterium]